MDERRREPAPVPRAVLSYRTGLPDSVVDGTVGAAADEGGGLVSGGPMAVWGDDGELLVVTWGSSRCPQLPVSVEVESGVLVVTTAMYLPGGPCTRDMVPTTSVVAVPDGVDPSGPVLVSLDGVQSQLDPR